MSRRRMSVARSPCTCIATDPSAVMALPPPPSSSVNSSSRGASSPSIRRRRRAIADLNASTGKPSPETIPTPQITAAVLIGTNETLLAPSTAMQAESAIANAVTRSGHSRQPASSRSIASLARRPPTCSARTIAGGAERRARPMASIRGEAPPNAMNTAAPLSAPAATDVATKVGSGIAEPHALQAGQKQQAPHPQIAGGHHREHCQQEGLPGQVVVGIEVGRAQGGERDEEHDGERHDDGGGRTSLHLKCASFALNLLSTAHRSLEIREQRGKLATNRALDEDSGGKHVEQRLADTVSCCAPGPTPAHGRRGADAQLPAPRPPAAPSPPGAPPAGAG